MGRLFSHFAILLHRSGIWLDSRPTDKRLVGIDLDGIAKFFGGIIIGGGGRIVVDDGLVIGGHGGDGD
jgi:hypothetical protein